MTHPFRVELYLILFQVATQNGYLCHTSCWKQTRTNCPVGDSTQVEHRCWICRKADNQHLTQYGRLWSQCWFAHIGGQWFIDYCELFAYNLPGQINIRSPVKFYPNYRKSICGRRAYAAHACCTIYRSFYGKGDELFHFFSCHSIGLSHDDHCRRIEVGEYVHFCMHCGIRTANQQQHRGHEYQDAVLKREMYNFI